MQATIRALSIIAGAVSLFFIAQKWWHFGSTAVVGQIRDYYVLVFHTALEPVKPVVAYLALKFGFAVPAWWKDALVLYLSLGGATSRGTNLAVWWLKFSKYEYVIERQAGESEEQYQQRRDAINSKEKEIDAHHLRRLERSALWWMPVRFVIWPAYWFSEALLLVLVPVYRRFGWGWRAFKGADGRDFFVAADWKNARIRLVHGYIGSSVVQFTLIAVGAAAFVLLNAGAN